MIAAGNDLQINSARLRENIIVLSHIGREEGIGLYRMAFTRNDYEARKWLLGKFNAMGVDASFDGALNVIAVLPAGKTDAAIVAGSHLDTVPNAGALDGVLGVLIGMECMQCIKEHEVALNFPFEIVAFSDEEGRFGGMFGSGSYAGMITPGYLEEATDLDGVLLKDAMEALGYDAYKALDAARTPGRIKYFLEVHIEQGPLLYENRHALGIVTDITGLFKWQITFTGASNHAGTTPMHMRNDAFMGLADFAHEIPRIIDENGSDRSKMTIGKVQLLPGSPNTIPGQAKFSLDVRDTSPETLYELQDASRKALSAIARRRRLKFDFEELSWIDPVACDKKLIASFEKVSGKMGVNYITMPSGAAHDAQMVSAIAPVGILFVPSKGGVSHSPHEWTDWHDIETGANVLLHTLLELNESA
jgi:N-carbamoyl-L-amino-acid hydrolase